MQRLKSFLRRRRSVASLTKSSLSAKSMFNDCVSKIRATNRAIAKERGIIRDKVVVLEQKHDALSDQSKQNDVFLSKIISLLN